MDYTVGSLSDLIIGSVTPNKKKVVKKHIKVKDTSTTFEASPSSAGETQVVKNKVKRAVDNDGKENKLKKKRKLKVNPDGEPVKKKSKNAENAQKRISLKDQPKKDEEDPELRARTVFVGNVPLTLDTKRLTKFFAKYGKVDSVRIRGVPVANPKTPKKVAFIKKDFHPNRKSVYAFVRFIERDDAVKATEANGIVLQDHRLRIHLCDAQEKPDENKAIFVGNLSFYAEENDLWTTFESCGSIASVRIVRDGRTGMGKGFGYVNFENSDSVTLALEMENVKLKDRELRISACNINAAKKKNKKITKAGGPKKIKKEPKTIKKESKSESTETDDVKTPNKSYQGVKFMQKKKKKLNKGLLLKKKKVKQIAPK